MTTATSRSAPSAAMMTVLGVGVAGLTLIAGALFMTQVLPSVDWDRKSAECSAMVTGSGSSTIEWALLPTPHFVCTYQRGADAAVRVEPF